MQPRNGFANVCRIDHEDVGKFRSVTPDDLGRHVLHS